jgi:hypothetical protein
MSSKSRRKRSQQTRHQVPWLWMLIAGLVLVVAGGAVVAMSSKPSAETLPQGAGEPKLTVDQTLVDEGYVKFNVPVRSTFHLSNVGDQPLKILDAPVELVEGC